MTAVNPYANLIKMINTDDGEIPFLRDIWGFFSLKGVKTSFVTINPDKSFRLDIEICENLGCPIRILTNDVALEEKWATIARTLKARKIEEADKDKPWLEGIQKKWILPKNLIVKNVSFDWNTLKSEIQQIPDTRIDILKIETQSDEDRLFLYSMMDAGFRPGVLLVKYNEDPDASIPAMLAAGHLQMAGYRLLETKDNWFFYLYTDICFYDSCSWRNTKIQNPLIKSIVEVFNTKKQDTESNTEEKNSNA